ncbi:winged helix-turn-helix transcriptional regulator [Aestuariivirga litoralis]|uniref:winged helix-turn-helix transcriptional regulator n=1 Tax=Aestuariivirga litoralis TaxID=2650924 RepID=UPI0018C80D5F|nr:helix-turn-helix domain-containing protein [Aestuariivirga litoralis]MBG1233306.1 helix-turn-helix transcriptional regulator [Aestuariivirga litoralis]
MDEQLSPDLKGTESEAHAQIPEFPPEVEALTTELIGHIADKWTMLVLEELANGRPQRFTALRKAVPGVSQKMLTQTLRQMERVGLVTRKVHPVIPPRVEYQRTELGHGLGKVVCHLWNWVANNSAEMQAARTQFDAVNFKG